MDFAAIKTQVRILDLMSRYSVHLKGGKNGWFNGDCPLPTHEKSKGTFAVNASDNFWMCHSDSCQAKRGKKGGDVITFVKVMENSTDKEAAEKLAHWFNLQPEQKKATHMEPPKEVIDTTSKNQSYPSSSSDSVKGRYMQEVDAWFNELIVRGDQEDDETYLKRLRNAVKTRLMESYRNGQRAAQGLVPAA